ncbi:MAG: hypothetical protein JSR82_13470 [Verrucomicrobia bacterium]|nr:hypothetical protein [Verrucomicrobiota bacterium]
MTALAPLGLSAQVLQAPLAVPEAEPLRVEVGALESRLAQAGSRPNSIVFFGSSSIRLWSTLDRDFPGRTVVNCGFGGSTLRDWLRYGPGIFARVKPRAIVLYCGENDLARGEAPETVFQNFQALYAMLASAYPDVPVAYLSVKPSPLRAHLKSNVERFNSLAASYLRTRKAARFLDIFNALLKPGGELDPALYRPDRLHLSASGYAVLQREVDTFLREAAPLGNAGS